MSERNDGLMWALVKEKPEEGLWMKRIPIPEVGSNDVKIKIHKTAICGTDVHIYQWNDWAQHTIPIGLTAGHEYVGEIVEVGPGVKGFKIGDLVSGEGHITCGKCRNCLEGHKENCKDAKGVGVNRNGAFAEYLVIPSSNVWPCNPNIPISFITSFRFSFPRFTALVAPSFIARSRRYWLKSVITTCLAPENFAIAAAMIPIGPAPATSTSSPSIS